MKAEVARIYSEKANSTGSRVKKIYDLIRRSADAGLYFVILENVDQECQNILIKNGYNLYEDGQGNCTIEW